MKIAIMIILATLTRTDTANVVSTYETDNNVVPLSKPRMVTSGKSVTS